MAENQRGERWRRSSPRRSKHSDWIELSFSRRSKLMASKTQGLGGEEYDDTSGCHTTTDIINYRFCTVGGKMLLFVTASAPCGRAPPPIPSFRRGSEMKRNTTGLGWQCWISTMGFLIGCCQSSFLAPVRSNTDRQSMGWVPSLECAADAFAASTLDEAMVSSSTPMRSPNSPKRGLLRD